MNRLDSTRDSMPLAPLRKIKTVHDLQKLDVETRTGRTALSALSKKNTHESPSSSDSEDLDLDLQFYFDEKALNKSPVSKNPKAPVKAQPPLKKEKKESPQLSFDEEYLTQPSDDPIPGQLPDLSEID